MKSIKLKRNQLDGITRIFLIDGNMGDFYILQNTDILKEMNIDSDIMVDIADNYDDVQLGFSQREHMILLVSYPQDKKYKMDSILDSFQTELETNYRGVSIFSFNNKTLDSDYKTLLMCLNQLSVDFDDKDVLKESLQRILFTLFEGDVDGLMEMIISGTLSIERINLDSTVIPTTTDTLDNQSIIDVREEEQPIIKESSEDKRRELIINGLCTFIEEMLGDEELSDEEFEVRVYEVFKGLSPSKKNIEKVVRVTDSNIETNINEELNNENNEEIESTTLTDEEYEKVTGETLEENISTESLKLEDNKMISERALELVKFLNAKWLKEIFPNVLHKIENIAFFKENMSKFKINEGDKPEDVVAKVAGGVVHLEVLGKNLSKWNNENENWKIDSIHTIKKNQRAWRKEFVKFKSSLKDSILPLISSILHKDEEVDLVEDEDSIDLCIINKSEPEIKDITKETSVESLGEQTNIYNEMSLESLMESCESESELFEKILNNPNVLNRKELIERGMKFNLITNEKLSLTDSIRRKVKVQNQKYN